MKFEDHNNSKYKKKLEKAKEEVRLGLHSFHRYYGKLIPAIPRVFIREFTKEGELVMDTFAGSGTTALEAKYLNRDFLGLEINPLSVLMIKVKTENYDTKKIKKIADVLFELIEKDVKKYDKSDMPFCVNRDHWFKDFVQENLIRIEKNIVKAVEKCVDECEVEKYKNFFVLCESAIIKQVSNADTMHVFPGISKRMRRLENEGKIHINVFDTYKRAINKRIKYFEELGTTKAKTTVLCADSTIADLKKYKNKVSLIVTNPPYISSVRYAETLKLELYWMKYIQSQKEYTDLSASMIGNDHISAKECDELNKTGYSTIDEYIVKMYDIDKKQAKVIYDYFMNMEKVIKKMSECIKKGGKVVIKISDSKIRKIPIPSGKLLTDISKKYDFELVDVFNDKINANSRSLLLSRNTYSDIILEDNIIIWEKK